MVRLQRNRGTISLKGAENAASWGNVIERLKIKATDSAECAIIRTKENPMKTKPQFIAALMLTLYAFCFTPNFSSNIFHKLPCPCYND